MEIKQTLRELFFPLGTRLGYFEYEKYLEDDLTNDLWGIDKAGFAYENLVDVITKKVNYYDPKEVYLISDEYRIRTEQLYSKIEDKNFNLPSQKKRLHKKTSSFNKKMLIQDWIDELGYYLIHLYLMQESREGIMKKEKKEDVKLRNNRIRWLGEKNQLPTLIFDLWQGQEKGDPVKGKYKLPALIQTASIKDLMSLIIENFEDSEGNPFVESSLSGILSRSKSKANEKAKGGKRIQLDYK